ncbi:MAG: Arm DNA-binding domain-containing protein [Ilumatobacteraceae bacterium]|nr:Arm DNA-binding domain-containing protein [Ilumatobacteraceae bacterium]
MYKRAGRWAYRVDAGTDPKTGKRRQVLRQGLKTRREALRERWGSAVHAACGGSDAAEWTRRSGGRAGCRSEYRAAVRR